MQEVAEGHRGGSLDIKTKWAQEVLERLGGRLDIGTEVKCMQKVVKNPEGKSWDQVNECRKVTQGGKFRYWNQMNAAKWGISTQVDTNLSPCVAERPEEVCEA